MKNQKRYLIVILSFLLTVCFHKASFSQVNISGVVNQYTAVTAITQPACAPCDVACIHTITVTDGSLFQPGDKALIIQMKGATINTANAAGSGNVTAINNAGNYEFFEVGSVVGNVLTPAYPLVRSYTVTGKVQVVRIPQFADAVNITGTLTALDWDETAGIGGVVAIDARKVTFNADINVLGQGYKGIQMVVNGTPDNCTPNPTTLFNVNNTTTSTYTKGDGIVLDNTATNRGRAPRANGGGAGISGDSGGGGGSNYGAGGEGGKRWCDINGANAGGIGGFSMTTFLAQNKVFLGGAGGPGFVTTDNPSNAADGGGVVIIFSDTIVGNGHVINARGTSPVAINPVGAPDGGGGGGAGGTVVLKTKTYTGTLTVDVSGGDGQDLNTNTYHGPGGGGGGGVLLYSLASLPAGLTLNTTGGIGGQHLDGERNGSQNGSAGGSISLYVPIQNPNYIGNIDNDVIQVTCDLDDDNDGIPDFNELYTGDHDSDGVLDYADPQFCTATFGAVVCATGLPDPFGDLDGDNVPNYQDADFAYCGGLTNGQICNNFDSDGDGQINSVDLDSDNDGIPDIVETGGTDINGDGQVDVATDSDGDGLADLYDVSCGGTGSLSATAGTAGTITGLANMIDASAATFGTLGAGGVVDFDLGFPVPVATTVTLTFASNVGGQNATGTVSTSPNDVTYTLNGAAFASNVTATSTANYTIPAGTRYIRITRTANTPRIHILNYTYSCPTGVAIQQLDSDQDGILNQFDLDSDNDGIPDLVEAGGVDTNGDGLVDSYNAGTGALAGDLDQDGFVDIYDGSANICNSTTTTTTISGNATTQTNTGVTNSANAIGVPDANFGQMYDAADIFSLGIANPMSQGTTVNLSLSMAEANPGAYIVEFSTDNVSFGAPIDLILPASSPQVNVAVVCNVNQADFIRIRRSDAFNLNVHGLSYSFVQYTTTTNCNIVVGNALVITGTDTNADGIPNSYPNANMDGDGAPNFIDLDSDNDGIADVIEAGGTDSNGDGRADGFTDIDSDGFIDVLDGNVGNDATIENTARALIITGTDGNNDGRPDTYPTGITNIDGQGFPNYIDIDSDNDGIADILEVGGVDANNDGRVDGFTDTDGDGWSQNVDGDLNNDFSVDNLAGVLIITGTDSDNNGKPNTYPQDNADNTSLPNFLDLDSDNDGIPDLVEAGGVDTNGDGTIDSVADTDADGLMNQYDASTGGVNIANLDSDGDGIRNFLDLDSDNDGISDVIEAGGVEGNGDGRLDNFNDTDLDGFDDTVDGNVGNDASIENTANALVITGTDGNADGLPDSYVQGIANIDGNGLPNFMDIDSDNDGLKDILEVGGVDANNDGRVDGFTDTDSDGWSQNVDGDVNNDFVIDNLAGVLILSGTDSDSNGKPNFYPQDNADNWSLPNFLDLDSDNDGIADLVEAGGVDTNGDGTIDTVADTDGDGLLNQYDASTGGVNIANLDSDGDGIRNYLDLDSDNDGIADVIEAGGVEANGDGRLDNFNDTDSDGFDDTVDGNVGNDASIENTANALILTGTDGNADGLPDTYVQGIANVDGNGLPNFIDIDSDNDGLTDIAEVGGTDANNDGRVDGFTDTDGDGWSQNVDGDINNNGTIDNVAGLLIITGADSDNNGKPNSYPQDNADQNGLPNFMDLDSDNDGIADLIEAGGVDTNGDGTIDTVSDTDGDGLLNQYDANNGGIAILNLDTDGDGIRNYVDIDSDNDGIVDVIEAGSVDANGDGRVDVFADTDNDGFADAVDGNVGNDASIENTAGALILSSTDGNADGRPDSFTLGNSDADYNPNFLDIDSDNDGIVDNSEAQATLTYIAPLGTDTDLDGLDNAYDTNNSGTAISPVNTDGADNPDYLDLDTDNDGVSDAIEGWDTDGNGTANTVPANADADNDGLDNAYDVNDALFNPTNATTPTSYPNVISSATPERDWREILPPTVTLSGTTSIAEDAAGVATLTATLSNVSTTDVTVTVAYTGTAVGADYAASSVTITIPAGSTTGTVTIDPTDDAISEGNETVIADITSVTGGNGATESGTQTATVTITDNDAPTVTLSGTTSIAEDAAGVATLTATLSNISTTATVVTLTYSGTAVGADYAASSVTITIPAGSTTGTVTVDPTDDALVEGSETVIADITNVTGGNGSTESGTQTATVTITDNDAPTVTLSGTTSIAEDAAGVATLTATLSAVAPTPTVVTVTYTGTAVGADYAASSVTITIPAGSTTGTVTVDPTDDVISEGSETVIADITSVTGGNGATESGVQTATVTITDNDEPTVTLSGTTSIAEDAAGVATLTATLSNVSTTDVTVTVAYTGTAVGADYAASSVTITIPAGSTTGTVTIDPTDDALFEGSETVIADITNVTGGNGATESGTQQATVTITDDEVAPTVTLSGTTSIAENAAGVATLTATLSVATTTATTITIGYTGTATNGTDYTPSSVTITIPAGSTTGTVTIDPTDDATSESSETVVADITNVTGGNGATESGTQTATVTITDDDTPNVSLSGTTTIAEDGVPNATLTLTLSVSSTQNVDVTLGYSGTATNGTDFALGTITVTIPAGSTTATFDIDPTSDLISEGNESVIIDITNVTGGNGASENGVQTATVTIIDNDAPTVTLSGTTSIAENAAGVATLTATLSNVSTTATVVTITYTGTAVGADYVASSVTITIPAGSTTGTVTIDPTDDVISEGSETVIADITSVTGGNGAIESGTQQAIVTITDNDAPTVTLSGTTSIAENAAGVATLTATLSNVATTDVTVTIGYTGTAVGADYAASSVTITIPAGSTTGTVTVNPTDDLISEGSETVIADITSVTGGNGATESGTQTATVTITDNDAPTVTLSGTTSIAEDAAGVATLTATLSNVSTTATVVTITYTGTAVGTDYVTSSVTITIPAGSLTGTVTIDPTDDVISEGSETVIADITSVTGGNGATESGTQQAIVTITDNDAPTVTLSGTTSIAEDAAGVATLTATLSNVSTTATVVTLTYTGTAVGTDYAASSVTITIPAGSLTGTVTVDPTDDLISEGSETVIADITSVTGGNGATESGTQQATVTITDNDAPTVTLSGTTSIAEDAAGVATLTATLSNASTTATVVTLTYTGTAIGADYVASSVTITIPAGSLTGTVTIDPTDDVISEGSETVIADITSVTGGNGATESGTQTATVTITDNDAPTVTLSGTTSIAEDAAGVVTLTATLSSTAPAATVVTLTYTGTAIGADYTASSVTITIPAGSLTGTVTVDPTDDLISEGSETVIADITSVTGGNGATESGTQTATVTITDNDAPTVTLSGTTSIAEDAAGVATLTATLSNVSTTATVVTLTYTGTAVGADYASSSVTITIPAGSLTGTVTIDPTDDVISEGSETVIADITSVTGGNGATESGTQQAIVTITDNDAPTVTLSGTTSIAEDAAGVATLTATLSNVSTTATVVTLTYTGTAIDGTDYTPSSVTITIPAGSLTGTVTIDPTDDLISEGSETVIADITSVTGGNGATESGTQTATVTITDNDAPTVSLSGTTSIAEDAVGVATLTATLSNVATTATVVTLTYTGTAVGTDYAASSVTITIPAGSLTGTVTVDPTVDAVYEGPETVIADITSVTGGNGATESGAQQAIVTIVDVNGPPVAVDNSTSTNEDQAVTLSTIQSNDTDSDGTVIVGSIDLDPTQAGQQTTFTDAQGTWVLNPTTGDVLFTPASDFNGTATIQYTIADNAGATSNSANLTVTVNPVNDAPIVDNEIITTNEDTPVSGDLTDAGDSDPDGTPLTVNTTPVDGPNNGTIVVNTDGTYTYTPNTNYNGFDTVIVSVCDAGTPGISCVNDTIFITVNPVNDAPIVDNEIITTNEDTPVSGDLTDAGDSDPDGTPLTVNTTPVDGPNNGTIVVNSDGTFTYTPNTNYNGLDTVIVSVCDAGTPGISCVNDTIFITVNPVNDAPIVDNEIITTNEDTPVSGDLTDAGDSDPDGTPLTVNTTPVDGPNNGTIVVNTDGTYTYTPNPNYNGLDTVVVSVCDAGAPGIICINDTIYVTVNPVNDAPIVDNEIITTNEDTPVSGDLTNAGDSDVDGNLVVTTTPVDGPNNGTIVINPDGSFTYNPNPNYVGQDTIVVQICDDGTPTPVICVNDTIFITINPCSASDLLADCDQDGVTNGDEIDPDGNGTPGPNGTDPLNPCSFNLADQDFALVSATWLASDCDGDGVTNGEEVDPNGDGTPGPNGTNPSNPCDYDGTLQDFATVSSTWLTADCDGDGVTNGEEVDPDGDGTPGPNGTNPNDPCEFDLVTQDFTTVSSSWLAADCDGDGVTNGDEVDPDGDGTPGPNGTDINNPCDFASANATVAPSAAWLAADCDGDGVTNGEEIDPDGDGNPGPNGTNPNNPCDFDSALQDFAIVSTAWLGSDCDGDGVTNGDEVDPDEDGTPGPNGTNPNNPCEFDTVSQDFTTVSTAWLGSDCDGDGVTNGDEVDPDGDGTPGPNGTNPSDPCEFESTSQDFATVSTAWLGSDCDGDGVTNGDEVDPDGDGTPGPNGTDINNPCDFDFANATVAPSAGWLAADCDGDGVTNGEEIDPDGDGTPGPNGTNPNDPCEFDSALQDFATVSTAWLGSDCDGDGVTNGDEVDPDGDGTPGPNGTNPSDPCDFVLSDTTIAPSAAWLAADCDDDGVTNGDEVAGGSDPLNACSPKPCDLFIPQAFTPDGDGVNDNFVIEGIELFPDNEIVILNRWGNAVFQTTNYQNDWNGTSNSSLNLGNGDLPTGTYYYILDPKKEGYEVYKGYIYLQR